MSSAIIDHIVVVFVIIIMLAVLLRPFDLQSQQNLQIIKPERH
jgi:hypothetical protein